MSDVNTTKINKILSYIQEEYGIKLEFIAKKVGCSGKTLKKYTNKDNTTEAPKYLIIAIIYSCYLKEEDKEKMMASIQLLQ